MSGRGAESLAGSAPAARLREPYRRSDIQGLRAIAVLAVVAFHAGLPVPGGFVGVDVFFVLSGFVITGMLQREWSQTGRISFRRFYWRRFARLTPALALMITVTMIIAAGVLSPLGVQQTASQTAVGAMFMGANIVIARTTGGYFDAPADANPLLNTWSLSVEEQFYLVFPALLALGWFLVRGKTTEPRRSVTAGAFWLVSMVAAGSFALAWKGPELLDVAAQYGFQSDVTRFLVSFYSPLTRAWEFAMGALLALASVRRQACSPRLANLCGTIGLLLLIVSFTVITEGTRFPGPWTLLPVAATVLLLFAGSTKQAQTSRWLSCRPMVKVGDWSYSIYLWHWPLIVFVDWIWPDQPVLLSVAAIASLAPALASYRWVEEPIRRPRSLTPGRMTRLTILVFAPPLAASVAVGFLAELVWKPEYESGRWVRYDGDIGSDEFFRYAERKFVPCTPNEVGNADLTYQFTDDGGGTFLRCQHSRANEPVQVALVGDSHAEHLFSGLADAFPDTNFAYYMRPAAALATLTSVPSIQTVVVSQWWNYSGVDELYWGKFLTELADSGKEVFVLGPTPDFSFAPELCRNRTGLLISSGRCSQLGSTVYGEFPDGGLEALGRVVSGISGVTLLPVGENFCEDGICSMTIGSSILFRDNNHLNLKGSRFLAGKLAEVTAFAKAVEPVPRGVDVVGTWGGQVLTEGSVGD